MKFVILLAIIGFVAVSAAPTKEELIQKATDLETKLDADIEKVKSTHPREVRILELEKRELKTLAAELEKATADNVVAHLEQRLTGLEHRVEEFLRHIEGQTGRPRHSTTTASSA